MSRDMHLLYVSFTFTALTASGLYLAAYLYAYSYDPWLTPRWTHYMIAWWRAGQTLLGLFIVLFPVGDALLAASPDLRKRWGVWCAVAAIVVVVLCCGIP